MTITQRWNNVCADTIGSEKFWGIAVDHRAAYAALAPLIEKYAKGDVLDVGAGRLAWRSALSAKAVSYLSTDMVIESPELSVVGDVVAGLPFADASFDTLFSCSVLEHTVDPAAALREMARLLRPGGALILSVPFIYFLHGAPHDYFRFTPFAVKLLAEKNGLRVEKISSSGGIAHLFSHAASMLVAAMGGSSSPGIALSSGVAWVLWKSARFLDKFDGGGRLAQNINAVLVKI